MKYFFVSDLHGCNPTLLQNTLNQHNFNPDIDTLVVLGDVCDRGSYTCQLVDYLLTLPHMIPIWGNHDARDYNILFRYSAVDIYDKHNGVGNTVASLLAYEEHVSPSKLFYLMQQFTTERFRNPGVYHRLNKLEEYFDRCVWAIEFADLIGCHGWLPHKLSLNSHLIPLERATVEDWYDASWANTEACITQQLFPSKPLIVGHWHSWRLHALLDKNIAPEVFVRTAKEEEFDYSPFIRPNLIAIDACTTFSQLINVYLYETDEKPILHLGNGEERA